ncbi:MAG: hypothetical protein ACFFDF_19495 [Candidatus Odinarchaeota archaeon]
MPRGMFLLIHDEIMGPEIKCSYYKNPVNLSKEFISKLYMSHAGFDSSSHIEIKFENYCSISCFTGNLDRRSQKEGILGIIFEENEEFDNLDLFLQRNLYYVIDNPSNETLQEIFVKKLVHYLELNTLFGKVEIEGIPEIFIINGNEQFKSCLLKVGETNVSISKMADLYQKIIKKQAISQYQYIKLNLESDLDTYLVLKIREPIKTIERLITTIKQYLEKFNYYTLEILALLLLPSVIKIIPLNQVISKKGIDKSNTFLQSLQQSHDYHKEFNNTISQILEGLVYISPSL